ncbi:phosphatidylinositol synthase 1 (CDP-alcohol phosphatidyltransferase1) [Blastocladiella emersonii ATCC 22665]|nr:phosphatidylinositol synthase 1 (CDP-alcohol phosphatidyltransferase1) [Blastocladiella emersonii ATCC 22665]
MSASPSSAPAKVVPVVDTTAVFLYWPNIIGYTRVVLAALACILMPSYPWACMTAYTLSCLMDAVDGHVARLMNQCSRFGAVLDMVTDRSTTTCLLAYLCTVHPAWLPLFQLLMALDLSSHYMHMYASLVAGSSSHKQLDGAAHPILRLYYHNKNVMFLVCAGNEFMFVGLYLLHHLAAGTFAYYCILALTVLAFPVCALKQGLNVVQLVGASTRLAELDVKTANDAAAKAE